MSTMSAIVQALPYVMRAYQRVQQQPAAGPVVVEREITTRVPIGDLPDEIIIAGVREAVNKMPEDWEKLLGSLGIVAAGSLEVGWICAHVTGAIAANIIVTRCIPSEHIARHLVERTVLEYTTQYASGTKWAAAMVGGSFGALFGYRMLTPRGAPAAADFVIRNQSAAAGSISTAAACPASTGPYVLISEELRPYVGMAVGATVSAIASYCVAGESLRQHIETLVTRLVDEMEREIGNDIAIREMEHQNSSSTSQLRPNSGRLMLQPQVHITEITDMERETNLG